MEEQTESESIAKQYYCYQIKLKMLLEKLKSMYKRYTERKKEKIIKQKFY